MSHENVTVHRSSFLSAMAADNGSDRRRVALITGITGQDGSYLAEFLLEKGYEVTTANISQFTLC